MLHTKPAPRSNSEKHEHYRNVQYQVRTKKREQKLKGDVDFKVFQEDR